MENYHIIEVCMLCATQTKGQRVKIKSGIYNTVIKPFDYKSNNSLDFAIDYLRKNGFSVVGAADAIKTKYYIVTKTFKPL